MDGNEAIRKATHTVNPIMKYFEFGHLPDGVMRQTSAIFCDIAVKMEKYLPNGSEKSTCLRKLLEAKDCAVRSVL